MKPSENPFFQTSNTDIGVNPQEKIKWKVEGHVPHFHASSNHKVDGNFSFLYTRTSDDIGSKVRKPLERKDGVLTKTEFLKKKREEYHSTMTEEEIGLESAPKSPTKVKPEDILKVYKHNSKNEDPRYTTSTVNNRQLSHYLSFHAILCIT